MRVRNYILQNFPFLEDDFDALTDYQLFCKMLGYVKKMSKEFDEFKTRLDKYEHYFDNLDVQEEIDNKLEEMLDNGELENIISQFLLLQTTFTYDTVATLKQATNLVDGTYVKTLGFYEIGKGGAYYLVREVTVYDTIDEITLIELDNNLVAELIQEKVMSPMQFGAKGDGETDDTLSINKCIEYANNILFDHGTYLINPIYDESDSDNTSINLKSNKIIDFNNATITMDETDEMLYYIIRGYQVNDIVLKNGFIIGYDETEQDGGDSEGMGIAIMDCSNVVIENMNIKNCRGDGIYIREYSNQKKTNNVYINNCIFKNNRRNQIGYTGGYNVKITNCDFDFDIDPEETYESNWVGIDIEKDHEYARFENFFISNCNFKGQPKAGISLSPVDTTIPCYGIIENCNINNCTIGIQGTRGGKSGDSVYIKNINISGCTQPPIKMTRGSNNMNLTFENIVVNSFTYSGVEDLNYMFYIPGASSQGVSDVKIINPVCKANCALVFMNNGINNVSIINPIFENGNTYNSWGVLGGRNADSKLILKDDYNQIRMNVTSNYENSNISVPSIIDITDLDSSITVTLVRNLVPEGSELTVSNLSNYNVSLTLQGNRTVTLPSSKGICKVIKLNSKLMYYGIITE